MKSIFKKLDNNTYYVRYENQAINVCVRYSKCNKHYEVDASQFYWEVKNIDEMKQKVESYFQQGKFTESFLINY